MSFLHVVVGQDLFPAGKLGVGPVLPGPNAVILDKSLWDTLILLYPSVQYSVIKRKYLMEPLLKNYFLKHFMNTAFLLII